MTKAEIVAHSLSPQGDELISVLATFPRIILAEVNTHRMLSKNTSSSRAIPFNKMVEAIENNPFIPIAWQKAHSGMQGSEYWGEEDWVVNQPNVSKINVYNCAIDNWLQARDNAISLAKQLNSKNVTKQLCNRLLEPFMWTTMLITGPKSGWDNFFNLRCPQYELYLHENDKPLFKSKKEWVNAYEKNNYVMDAQEYCQTDLDFFKINKGQAEIHMMDLAEKIYDAVKESTPTQLQAGEWHIPFWSKINTYGRGVVNNIPDIVRISVAMAARTSYTIVGEEKEIDWNKMIELHDRLLAQDPPHSSPLEHCSRVMNNYEYVSFYKGQIGLGGESGWCNNFKGFIPYRYLVDNKIGL